MRTLLIVSLVVIGLAGCASAPSTGAQNATGMSSDNSYEARDLGRSFGMGSSIDAAPTQYTDIATVE